MEDNVHTPDTSPVPPTDEPATAEAAEAAETTETANTDEPAQEATAMTEAEEAEDTAETAEAFEETDRPVETEAAYDTADEAAEAAEDIAEAEDALPAEPREIFPTSDDPAEPEGTPPAVEEPAEPAETPVSADGGPSHEQAETPVSADDGLSHEQAEAPRETPNRPIQKAAQEAAREAPKKASKKPAEKRRLTQEQKDFLKGKYAVSNSATLLVLVIYGLLLLSRLIDANFLGRESEYLSIILLQLMIFPIPAYLYVRLKPEGFIRSLRLSRVRLSHLFLILSASLILISGCTLLGMLCGMMSAQPSFTLYDTFASVNDGTVGATLRLMLAYGLLPAFCEELVFRGVICAEHEKHGILYASVVSALFFAFLHFDLTALPVYLFAGVLLSLVAYITRSTVAAMIVHLCYNLFGIFVQAGLSGYCKGTGSVGLLVVLLIALLLLSAAFFCGEVARVLRRRARADLLDAPDDRSTPGLNRLPARLWPRALLSAFASPAGVAAVALWLFGVVANLLKL